MAPRHRDSEELTPLSDLIDERIAMESRKSFYTTTLEEKTKEHPLYAAAAANWILAEKTAILQESPEMDPISANREATARLRREVKCDLEDSGADKEDKELRMIVDALYEIASSEERLLRAEKSLHVYRVSSAA